MKKAEGGKLRMGQSIVKNLFYNLLLQVITMVLPLITVPYISRVLGAQGIGIYSYTLSITQYFIIIGTIGLSLYGNRQIAYTRDDKQKMSKTFWSILFLRFVTTGSSTVIYYLIFKDTQNYNFIFKLQTLNILASMIDISWLYIGLEEFKKTVTRNLAIKLIGVFLIFTMVKIKEDLSLYVLINALMTLLGNLVMWMYLPKTVCKVKINRNDIMAHLGPSIKLLLPQIAIQVYVVLDKTMIGVLSDVTQVGYYEQSEKIIKTVLGLVTALGTVMLPRMSNIYAKGEKEKMNNYLNMSLKGVAYIAVPMSIGIASISIEFVYWFFGADFESAKYLIIALSPILFIIAMSSVTGMQYLLPSNRTKEFTFSVIIGSIVNVILNLLLIPSFKAMGACIATVVAEFSVTAIQCYFLRSVINIKEYMKGFIKYIFASLIMTAFVRIIGIIMGANIITTIVQCLLGLITYIFVLLILREKVNATMLKSIYKRIRKA